MNQTKLKMLENNHKYKIRINAGGQVLTYSCKVLEKDDNSVKVKDKFDGVFYIGLGCIISYEELDSGGSE